VDWGLGGPWGYGKACRELSLARLVLCLVGEDITDIREVGVGDSMDVIKDVI